MYYNLKKNISLALAFLLLTSGIAFAGKPVTVNNFVRAETDNYITAYANQGGFGQFHHIRVPTPIDKQDVIRMNRDTLYSMGTFDLNSPVTIGMPNVGERFQSMQVISQDHYTPMVEYKPGKHKLTKEKIGTRYVIVLFRTFVDSTKPEDIKLVNKIQDQITVEQASKGELDLPDWDQKSLSTVRDALNVLSATSTSAVGMFGSKDEVDPINHLLGTAFGWGGNPTEDATYLNVLPDGNDGKTAYTLTVKDVPVDGFWSISLYNGKGFFEKNDQNAYSVNDHTAVKNSDGSFTIHFGGDPTNSNYLAIMDGWNYIVRLYQPRKEILDGSWKFPKLQPVK